MFGKRDRATIIRLARENRDMAAELAIAHGRLSQLRRTRIRINVPTDLGVRPLYDVDIESAIMMTNMRHGADPGYKVEGMSVEVISEYTPLVIPGGDEEDADDILTGY